jgi:hypothetical protein
VKLTRFDSIPVRTIESFTARLPALGDTSSVCERESFFVEIFRNNKYTHNCDMSVLRRKSLCSIVSGKVAKI